MFQRYAAAAAVFLCALSGCTKDPDGWQKLSWEASLGRIKLAYPDVVSMTAEEIAAQHVTCPDFHGSPLLSRLSKLGGHDFQTYFCVDDGGLRAVKMRMVGDDTLLPSSEDPVLQELSNGLGKPASHIPMKNVYVYTWSTKKTGVILMAIEAIAKRKMVTVDYFEPLAAP